ncbi:MAG: hypothetical protein CVT79_17435 [Alphaproteobacteria bacterium HGW-Alphaproteobacteria-18]|nr:MAG: hypothetical protein CVT79_17435 [Alphaproteobacteria bacterium HGW-Alphaproteobacteria-18]
MLSFEIQNSPRFAWIYQDGVPRAALWDTVLATQFGSTVVPSLGSIVPGWTLTFPRMPSLNLANSADIDRENVFRAARQAATVARRFESEVYHFEHGAAGQGSLVGCGIDLAHLHTVPLGFDLLSAAIKFGAGYATWTTERLDADLWCSLRGVEYYLVWKSGSEEAVVGRSLKPTSQFFRRVIADRLGMAETWDYKTHAFAENISLTQKAFAAHDREY